MSEIKKQIFEIQQLLKTLNSKLVTNNIDMTDYVQEMIECLAFVNGYSEKTLQLVNN